MKTTFLFKLLLVAPLLMLLAVVPSFTQGTIDSLANIETPGGIDLNSGVEVYINWYNALYAAIFIILGYVHNYIPFVTASVVKWVRIALAAIVSGLIFYYTGVVEGISLVVTFLSSIGIYSFFLNSVAKKPSPPIKNLGVIPKKVA